MIIFATQNVVSDPPFTRIDLIVCRNLLIYLDPAAQKRVLQGFHYALRQDGLLFLGTSETPGEAGSLFDLIDSRNKILRRKEVPVQVHPALLTPVRPRIAGEGHAEPAGSAATGVHMLRSIERVLLERFAPCSVVVDERGTIMYIHGRSGLYLEPEQGQPRNSVLEMAREGLGPALAAVMRQAKQEEREIVRRGVRVRTNGDYAQIDLSVKPLNAPEALRGLLLVTFEPSARPAQEAHKTRDAAPTQPDEAQQLAQELQYTRESLQTTVEELQTANEELKSSNEELQSTNEELQSANEELETSREEMQALNEELNTVNNELTSKVGALGRANDDMNNLLNSMQVATVFLDTELRVKRYTDKARDVVRLIGTDVGRPLSDLTSSLRYDDLIGDCRRILASLIPIEKEVQDEDGRWYLVRLMPYRTADNVIDGVVMTILDIDRIKRAQAGMDFFQGIVQTVREPLVVLDDRLHVVSANSAFYQAFATEPARTEGTLIYELGNRQWDIPELRRLLEDVLPSQTTMTDFAVEHEFPRIGRRKFMLNARRLQFQDKEPGLILLAMEDITE